MTIFNRKAAICLGISATALLAQTAAAQSRTADNQPAAPLPGTAANDGVADIIVTAQKRSESVQKVPIAITAVSGATLLRAGVTSTDALQNLAPGLNIAAVGSGFVSYTYVRGGGTNQVDIGADPSVAYFIDEIYIGGTAGLQADLFDIDHVEVLKGPQGTLFGRNAASGAISIVTKRPEKAFSGYARFEGGNYGDATARFGITGPLAGDSLLYRVSVGAKHDDGYTKDLAGGTNPGRLSSLGGRAQVEWRGNDVNFLVTADGLRTRNGETGQFFSTTAKSGLITPAAAATYPLPGESFYAHYYRPGFENQDLWSLSGRLEWQTPIGQLIGISAYRNNRFKRSQDYSPGTNALTLNTDERDKTFSQEVRLVSAADQRLRYVGGLYYYHGNQSLYYAQVAGPTFAAVALQNATRTDTSRLITNSYAAFGQISYDIFDKVTLIGGLRYTLDKKSDDRLLLSTIPSPAFNFTASARDKWHALTPAATAQYTFSPQVMAYFSYRQGFKSGGFQPAPAQSVAVAETPFNPEHVNSYEVGLKSTLFDRKLTFDIDAFLSKIRDQQISQTLPGAVNVVSNAGATTAKGVDISMQARPLASLRLSADMTYQRAKFDQYQTIVAGNATSFAGFTQLRSPDFTVAVGADYDFDLGNSGKISVGGRYNYRTNIYFTPNDNHTPGLFQPGYGLADTNVTYTPERGNWDLSFWMKNIGNTRYYRNVVVVGTTGLAQPGDPRTYGGSFSVRF